MGSYPDLQQFQGLTEEEVVFRLPPSRNEEHELEARQVRRETWCSSTLAWVFIVRAIWRAPWLSRFVGILSDRLEG